MAWSVLQSAVTACHFGTGMENSPVTFPLNVSSGTVLIAANVLAGPSGANEMNTCKDGAGNSFTKLLDSASGLAVWVLATPAGDVGTKPTITATPNSLGAFAGGIWVAEVSGISGSLDGTVAGLTFLAQASGSAQGPPSYTSTAANEFLLYIYCDQSGQGGNTDTWTAPGGAYTTDPHTTNANANGSNLSAAYKNSTNGVEAGTWSATTSAGTYSGGLALVAFQLGSPPVTSVAAAQYGDTDVSWEKLQLLGVV